jgi:hypothetical protein
MSKTKQAEEKGPKHTVEPTKKSVENGNGKVTSKE